MNFGDILRELLADRNMTQKELARQLNIAPSTLGNYIQDSREPDFATLKAIADHFHVSVDYLLDHREPTVRSRREDELLHIYRDLEPRDQALLIDIGKAMRRAQTR